MPKIINQFSHPTLVIFGGNPSSNSLKYIFHLSNHLIHISLILIWKNGFSDIQVRPCSRAQLWGPPWSIWPNRFTISYLNQISRIPFWFPLFGFSFCGPIHGLTKSSSIYESWYILCRVKIGWWIINNHICGHNKCFFFRI